MPKPSTQGGAILAEHHLYEHVARTLREQMDSGALSPGDRLPTQEELCRQFDVSRIVVRRALDLLASEGIIDRPGTAGAFVRKYNPLVRYSTKHYRSDPGMPFAEEALASERIPSYSAAFALEQAGSDIAARLNIEPDDVVLHITYVSSANDEPMMVVHSYEPRSITQGTIIENPEKGPYGTAGLVDRFTAIGMRPTSVVERLRTRMPRPSETELLKLAAGIPVMLVCRTTLCGQQRLETADIIFNAHRYELEYAITVEPS
jgi:GntR family transcriptional regulator